LPFDYRSGHSGRSRGVAVRSWLAIVGLPVCGRLWPQLDVGNIRIAVCPVRTSRRLPVLRILTTRGLLLAPLDEGFLSFAFCSGRSGVSGHAASSAYTIGPHVATVLACKFRVPDNQQKEPSICHLHLAETGARQTVHGDLRP